MRNHMLASQAVSTIDVKLSASSVPRARRDNAGALMYNVTANGQRLVTSSPSRRR